MGDNIDIIQHVDSDTPTRKYDCIHGISKYSCIECRGSAICIHNKVKYRCEDCGKSWKCDHNKKHGECKVCDKENFCIHDKTKKLCATCDGSWLCDHKRQKAYCKDCGGSQYCHHGRRRAICKDCKGTQLCIHNKVKYDCVDCKGTSVCPHNKLKHCCKDCKGNLYCEHNISKAYCKQCKGSAICIHNNYKKRCIDCNGVQICEHKKIKNTCKLCKGSQICIHSKIKYSCKECDGRHLCKSSWCHTSGIKKYNGYCFQCTIHLHPDIKVTRNYKTKENTIVEYIKNKFPDFTWVNDKRVSDGCSRRRPDLLLDMGTHIIIIEVDENQHTSYDCSCENKRIMEISQDNSHRPIVFIRFNPDSYIDISGGKVNSCWSTGNSGITKVISKRMIEWEKRLNTLLDIIDYWIKHITTKTVMVIELFFDGFIS